MGATRGWEQDSKSEESVRPSFGPPRPLVSSFCLAGAPRGSPRPWLSAWGSGTKAGLGSQRHLPVGSGSQVQDMIPDTMQPPGTHSPLQGPASEAELLIQMSREFRGPSDRPHHPQSSPDHPESCSHGTVTATHTTVLRPFSRPLTEPPRLLLQTSILSLTPHRRVVPSVSLRSSLSRVLTAPTVSSLFSQSPHCTQYPCCSCVLTAPQCPHCPKCPVLSVLVVPSILAVPGVLIPRCPHC